MYKSPRGRFQGPYCEKGGEAGALNELNHPARDVPPPPVTKLIRNPEETVRYIICASGA
jgi:hypothetical protein